MDACFVSKSGLEPLDYPTGVFNGGLQVPASFLELSFWTHGSLDYIGGLLWTYWMTIITGFLSLDEAIEIFIWTILWISVLMKFIRA